MRYMGAVEDDVVFVNTISQSPLDPTVKARMLAEVRTLPDAKAQDLIDLADETPLGHKSKLMRIGMGIAIGFLAGLVVVPLLKGKR